MARASAVHFVWLQHPQRSSSPALGQACFLSLSFYSRFFANNICNTERRVPLKRLHAVLEAGFANLAEELTHEASVPSTFARTNHCHRTYATPDARVLP